MEKNLIKICSLYSGSSGNCTLIKSENAKILIDAGKSAKALTIALKNIGEDIGSIDAIFITHEHIDHVSALNTLTKKYNIPIHATEGCARELSLRYEYARPCIVPHSAYFTEVVGDLTVSSFLTSHDSACPVGYKFTSYDGDTAGLMTDSGIVTNSAAESLSGCRAVVLEANHDLSMLKNGPYPHYLKERVASRFGHLSNSLSARFAEYLAENGTKSFLLAHLSAENNTPEIALSTLKSRVLRDGCVFTVASPNTQVFME